MSKLLIKRILNRERINYIENHRRDTHHSGMIAFQVDYVDAFLSSWVSVDVLNWKEQECEEKD